MSNKRQRQHRRSPSSSASSVSSSSLLERGRGEDGPSEYRPRNLINNNHDDADTTHDNHDYDYDHAATTKKKSSGTTATAKSIFSGFWSDAELEDGDKENDKHSRNSNSNSNSNSNRSRHNRVIDYEGFYLTIGKIVYEIGVGDVVAMRNAGSEDDDNDDHDHDSNNDDNYSEHIHHPKNERSVDYATAAHSDPASGYYRAADVDVDVDVDVDANETTTTATATATTTTTEGRNNTPPNTEQEQLRPPSREGEGEANDQQPLESATLPKGSAPEGSSASSDARDRDRDRATAHDPTAAARSGETKVGDGFMLARVERIWKEKGTRGKVLFQARWFLKKEDVDSLPLGEITGPVAASKFADSITEHDLVLSNQSDDNHVTTICDLVQVLYRNPDLDKTMPSSILPTTYLCRYSLGIDDDSKVVVLPYTGEVDGWGEMTVAALASKKKKVEEDGDGDDDQASHGNNHKQRNYMQTGDDNHHSEDDGGNGNDNGELGYNGIGNTKKRRRVGDFADNNDGIDEGTTEQRDIQVGRDHQVYVPPFDPHQKIVSRNPTRMWKPDIIGQEETDDYIERASKILTPYLRRNRMTQEEPYAPFPTERMEELSKSLSWKRLPTLSSVSTVSSLTTHKADALREVNIDALLRNLHVSNYNVNAAIAAIEASPADYVGAWSPHEKARFNTGFRRYSGSLRAIYKGMGNKALREVIDYHYRFKIPDQFRRFQERKREQAIRMLECIETRRNLNTPIQMSNTILAPPGGSGSDEKKDGADWSKLGNASVAVSVEGRRVRAKQLLLDVEAKLGKDTMAQVFEIFRNADETALLESKTKLMELFRQHQEFQSRFLEFLPQQMRL